MYTNHCFGLIAPPVGQFMYKTKLFFLFPIVLINVIQNKRSHWLPHFIRDWSFLPLWMRSLKPLDDFFSQLSCCSKCINPPQDSNPDPEFRDVESAMHRVNEKGEFHHISHMEEMQVLVNCTGSEKHKQEMEAISRQEA